MSLLHLLKEAGYSVTAAHLNHHLRPNAGLDASFVEKICAQWHVPLISKEMDVQAYCNTKHVSVEEGAREVRYSFLFESARETNSQAVAVGHHADDQVETVLMHFLRGAGLSGLKGMLFRSYLSQYSAAIPLIRPLLEFSRQEIHNYCLQNRVPYVEDETNADTRYDRNRLRSELIPKLEAYHPAFKKVLMNNVKVLQADYEFIESELEKAWENCAAKLSNDTLSLELDSLQHLQRGLRWNLLRKAVKTLQVNIRDFDLQALERLDELVMAEFSFTVELTNHLTAQIHEGRLWLSVKNFVPPVSFYPQTEKEILIGTFPAIITTSNGWVLQAEMLTQDDPDRTDYEAAPKFEAWLDAGSIRGLPLLRYKKSGEKMQPLGMNGKYARVSDLFINQKVSRLARQKFPLLVDEEKVVWIPGIGISEACRIKPQTRVFLHLRFIPPD